MKKLYLLLTSCLLVCVGQVHAQTLVHYWNFNTSTNQSTVLAVTTSAVGTPSITHEAGGTSVIEVPGTGQNFNVQNLNARNGDASGDHLRFNNPGSGGSLLFALPTTGYKDVIVKYATRRSSTTSAAEKQIISYSVDGTSFEAFTTFTPVAGDPTLVTLDFSSIDAVDNNPNFKIRIAFQQGTGGTTGNHRFDNFTVDGANLSSDVTSPSVTFDPLNNAMDVFVYSDIKLTFSEDVRKVDDAALDNSNIASVIELRRDNASGTIVAFAATISGRTVTINPTDDLLPSQTYYVSVKPNMVEDLAGNAITTSPSVIFTTTPQQTIFSTGDLAFVGYRMNATATDDEIALLTFVNILPGTLVNFTDAKYTDNGQAQCAGGFTWKAPAQGVAAGTVITFKTDAATPSIGTTTGSGFGLSSGGDQVIVYTGTAADPRYITSMSSNAWVTSNANCSGSNSKIPVTLVDGQTAINLSAAPGNTGGNTVNAYYAGSQSGTTSQIRAAVFNAANWVGVGSGTAAQAWPTWAFPGPPSVSSTTVVNQTTLKVTFNNAVSISSATTLANYSGIANLQSASIAEDQKTITLVYGTAFTAGQSYTLSVSNVQNTDGVSMIAPYDFAFTYNTKIGFQSRFVSVNETAGSAAITLKIENPSAASIKINVKPAPWSTATSNDLNFAGVTVTLTGSSDATQNITIPIVNDSNQEQDEYVVLTLEDAAGLTVNGSPYFTLFIKDDDRVAPVATKSIELKHKTSFNPPQDGTAEIVVHDPASKRLFVISSVQQRFDIADFSNPSSVAFVKSVDMTPYGGITSIATYNGIVAAASPNTNGMENGSVVFFNTNGEFLKQVTVGVLPDMVTFTPDGKKVLTANEGQPNDSYTVDPEGSVSVIDISGGVASLTNDHVSTLLFTSFNAQESALRATGIRKLKASSTLSQDFEPEYITVSSDSKKAWITLQENNAIAELNLETKSYTAIWPLGKKDMSLTGNGFDASDNSGVVNIANWPVRSFYIPDAVANFTVNGVQYLVTANEGDEKEYAGLNERTTVGAVTLDGTAFPNGPVLKENHNLGRLRISNLSGDTDGDGDYDELNAVGGRSFSIWNANTHQRVFDSGDEFERITAADATYGVLFNSDNEANGLKTRSRAKGPEPEGVAVASFNNKTYAFISLERIGGVMAYDITDPAQAKFVDYKNNRGTTAFTGDHGPEGIIFISRENSPDGKRYVLVANEISGTVSVYEVMGKDDQSIAFAELSSKTIGDTPFLLTATATSGLPVSFMANGDEVTLNGQQVSLVKPGRISVTALQAGNDFFNAAAQVERSFCVNPAKPSISIANEFTGNAVLTSSASEGNQWFKNGVAIAGANSKNYQIESAGTYTVQSVVEECASVISDSFPVIITDVEVRADNILQLHPNPASEKVVASLPGTGEKQLTVYDARGVVRLQRIERQSQTELNISGLEAGYYILLVRSQSGSHYAKFIKE